MNKPCYEKVTKRLYSCISDSWLNDNAILSVFSSLSHKPMKTYIIFGSITVYFSFFGFFFLLFLNFQKWRIFTASPSTISSTCWTWKSTLWVLQKLKTINFSWKIWFFIRFKRLLVKFQASKIDNYLLAINFQVDKFLSPTSPLYNNNSALFQPPLPLDDFNSAQRPDAQGFSYQGVYGTPFFLKINLRREVEKWRKDFYTKKK